MADRNEIINALGTSGIETYYHSQISTQFKKGNSTGDSLTNCVFHPDKTPSLSINFSTGTYKCFGCHVKGSIFDFHNHIHGGEFKDAAKYFCDLAGLEWKTSGGNGSKGNAKQTAKKKTKPKKDFTLAWDAARGNAARLDPDAIAYLDRRGFNEATKKELIKNQLGFTISAYYEKGVTAQALVAPMWQANKKFEKKKVVGLQHIFTGKDLQKKFAFDSKPTQGLFFIGDPKKKKWILTEAVIDAVSVWQATAGSVFCIAAFSADVAAMKKVLPVADSDIEIICFFDNDSPGKTATRKIKSFAPLAKSIIWQEDCKPGHDVNDFLKAGKDEIIRDMINKAVPIEDAADNVDFSDLTIPEAIERINESYAAIMISGKFLILNELIDPDFGWKSFQFITHTDFKLYFQNKKVEGIDIATYWMNSSNRREFKGMYFEPGDKNKPEYYNLWHGFTVSPKKGNIEKYLKLTRDVIANGNDFLYNWVLTWLSDIVKNPGTSERAGTSIALRGEMGTGKSFWVERFGEILGPHFLQVSSAARLVNRFNYQLKNALLVFCDEGGFFAADKRIAAVLKDLITGKTNIIEPKGVNPIVVKNFIRLIFATNEPWAVPAGMKERRFLVNDVGTGLQNNREFFEELQQDFYHGGYEALLDFLLNFEPEEKYNINIRKIPKTDALLDQIMDSLTTIEKFWYDLIYEGDYQFFDKWIDGSTLYDKYLKSADIDGQKYKLQKSGFSRNIRKMCPEIRLKKIWEKGSSTNGFLMPSVRECREIFQKNVVVDIKWPDLQIIDYDNRNDIGMISECVSP